MASPSKTVCNLPFNVSVDGKTPQKLTNVKVEPDGRIKASYGTSEFLTIGQVGLARFSNESGLRSIGKGNFLQTTESGLPTLGNPKDLGKMAGNEIKEKIDDSFFKKENFSH